VDHLLIFDIDGTLTDSTGIDDKCMEKSLSNAGNLKASSLDWSSFTHPTDAGIVNQLFENDEDTKAAVKSQFLNEMFVAAEDDPSHFSEILGASALLQLLEAHGFDLAIATGSWKKSGLLKLKHVSFDTSKLPFAHCDLHFDRVEIARHALESSKAHYKKTDWHQVTYFGDGTWDFSTAVAHNFSFIGIDLHGTKALNNLGDFSIYKDWTDPKKVVEELRNFG